MNKQTRHKLFLGDATDFLSQMDDRSARLVFTSPPYNMRLRIRNGRYSHRELAEHFSIKYGDGQFHDAFPIEVYYHLHKELIGHMLRVAEVVMINVAIVTGSKEAWFRLMGDFAPHIRDVIVWDKGGQPAMHPTVINRETELIIAMESDAVAGRAFNRVEFDRGTMSDIWRIGRSKRNNKLNKATFPMELPRRAIAGWTRPGELVIDPFMGTGTTGVAAVELGRRFGGSEIVKKLYQQAVSDITQASGDYHQVQVANGHGANHNGHNDKHNGDGANHNNKQMSLFATSHQK